ncbi:MAG: cysteine--tRNA ligase [Hydrotalea sp.]|nr:cysteine--tRNA ligase [Hydrotalea sp.]
MSLKVYNSLTRQKEVFQSITPGHVGLYVCGPTVSGESHLGHARPYITFDVLYRYLNYLGYQVRYVRNITDAGHFEEEGRAAEDKVSSKAILEKLEPMELVQKYTNRFHWAMLQFNNIEPSIEPTATGHIVEQINMIEQIIADGYAYVVNGSVYFDVNKYHKDFSAKGQPYGILSGRNLEEQLDTTRDLEGQDEKRNKADFALWKQAPPQHIMRWKSPWGEGFPGWHIECSAMATKYLGKQFDIHGGGMDLQFPHHECEIAQSTVCNHAMPARYWMHNNMITINGKKMGKSYNNVIKLSELFSGNHPLLTQPFHPMTIRFFILQSHYRSTLDFSNEALQGSERAFKRLWEAYQQIPQIQIVAETATQPELDVQCRQLAEVMDEYMNDDLNTAKVLANMFELVPVINGLRNKQLPLDAISAQTWSIVTSQIKKFIEDILGLKWEQEGGDKIEGVLQLLVQIRQSAKQKKDFQTSDTIRKELAALGILLKDEKDGTTSWSMD